MALWKEESAESGHTIDRSGDDQRQCRLDREKDSSDDGCNHTCQT
jgi:hypothetical protein